MRKIGLNHDSKVELSYGSTIGALSGILTSLAGSNIEFAALAGLAGYLAPSILRQFLPLLQADPNSAVAILSAKMKSDFEHSVLSCPFRIKNAQLSMNATLKRSRILVSQRASVFAEDVVPSSIGCWDGIPLQKEVDVLRNAGPILVSCCCTSPGFLAALETMRQGWGISINEDFHASSSRQQLDEIHSRRAEYDFLVVGGLSFTLQTGKLKDYKLMFPCTVDHQYALARPSAQLSLAGIPSIVPQSLSAYDKVYFVPATANETFVRQLSSQLRRRAIEISILDLAHVAGRLGQSEILLAWDPNAQVLINKHQLLKLDGHSTEVPICLAGHNRYFKGPDNGRNRRIARAFSEVFIAAWNFCSRDRAAALDRVIAMPSISSVLTCGLGLSTPAKN